MLIALACWRLDACSEASASYHASALGPRYCLTEYICLASVVVTKLKFCEVKRQIFLADMVKASHHAALEKAPERFQIIGVYLAANIFALAMAHRFMREIFFQETITGMFIGRDQIDYLTDGLADKRIKSDRICVLDYLADYVTLAADGSNHAHLATTDSASYMALFIPMAILVFSADKSFIYFDDTHQLSEIRIVHRSAKSHAHIPSRLIGTAPDLSVNLKGAHALLGIEHLPENLEPSLERILGILKNRPADDAEAVVLAWLAEPVKRPRVELIDGRIPASRTTDNPILPAPFHQELLTGFVRRKGGHQLAERHHGCNLAKSDQRVNIQIIAMTRDTNKIVCQDCGVRGQLTSSRNGPWYCSNCGSRNLAEVMLPPFDWNPESMDKEHFKGAIKCSGCWERPHRCICGGIIHNEFEDESEDGPTTWQRCDSCGENYKHA